MFLNPAEEDPEGIEAESKGHRYCKSLGLDDRDGLVTIAKTAREIRPDHFPPRFSVNGAICAGILSYLVIDVLYVATLRKSLRRVIAARPMCSVSDW